MTKIFQRGLNHQPAMFFFGLNIGYRRCHVWSQFSIEQMLHSFKYCFIYPPFLNNTFAKDPTQIRWTDGDPPLVRDCGLLVVWVGWVGFKSKKCPKLEIPSPTWWFIPRIVSGLVHPSYKWTTCPHLSHL